MFITIWKPCSKNVYTSQLFYASIHCSDLACIVSFFPRGARVMVDVLILGLWGLNTKHCISHP